MTILDACKVIVYRNDEPNSNIHKYERWYINRETYGQKHVQQHRRNAPGGGRKRSLIRQMIFDEVTSIFNWHRYEKHMSICIYDVADFFEKAAKNLGVFYDAKNSYKDALAWKRWKPAKYYHVDGKIIYKPQYITAKIGQFHEALQNTITKYHIKMENISSLDETMFFHDFSMRKVTLSYPGVNDRVIWIPNDKDTTSVIGIWWCTKLSLLTILLLQSLTVCVLV